VVVVVVAPKRRAERACERACISHKAPRNISPYIAGFAQLRPHQQAAAILLEFHLVAEEPRVARRVHDAVYGKPRRQRSKLAVPGLHLREDCAECSISIFAILFRFVASIFGNRGSPAPSSFSPT